MSEPKAVSERCEFEADKVVGKIDEVVACDARVINHVTARIDARPGDQV